MPTELAQVQALYLQLYHEAAKAKFAAAMAEDDDTAAKAYPIDPQGRVLVDVKLTDADWQEFYEAHNLSDKYDSVEAFKEAVIANVSHNRDKGATVSLDLQPKKEEPLHPLQRAALAGLKADTKEGIIDAYKGISKGKIISLQQETHFHAHLIKSMIKKAFAAEEMLGSHEPFEQATQRALHKLNGEVNKLFCEALEKAYKDGNIDENKLNAALDKARKKLLPKIAKTIREEMVKQPEIKFSKKITDHLSKHLAESTAATDNDYIHLDKTTGMISFIGGSEHTSHLRAKGGDKVADRSMYSHLMQEDGTVKALQQRQQIRVPSIAIKRGTDTEIIEDAANKLAHLQSKHKLAGTERGEKVRSNAFVYNLYTSLNDKGIIGRIDERSNKQSKSARHILQAAHLYNRNNLDKPLCFVQNVPVNGFGHALSINAGNPIEVNEAALMTQLASLHTVYDTLTEDAQAKCNEVFNAYKAFLSDESNPAYFYGTEHGSLALKAITEIAAIGAKVTESEETSSVAVLDEHQTKFVNNARKALAKFVTEEAYGNLDNGFTYQALSVFSEEASIGGCKSANERAQAVNGRVAILDFVSLNKATRDLVLENYSPAHAEKLRKLADDLETHIQNRDMQGITNSMNQLYESLNLESYQAMISLIDQGGHAKLQSKSGLLPNTNKCETITNHASKASKWQCHKGLTDHVLREFCGKEPWLKKAVVDTLKATVAGVATGAAAFGIVAGAIALGASIFFPPIGIAIAAGAALFGGVALLKGAFTGIKNAWNNRQSAVNQRLGIDPDAKSDPEVVLTDQFDMREDESFSHESTVDMFKKIGTGHPDPKEVKRGVEVTIDATGTGLGDPLLTGTDELTEEDGLANTSQHRF